MGTEREDALVQVNFQCLPALRRLILEAIDNEERTTISDVCSRAVAQYFGKPELGIIPRKRMGRPPNELRRKKADGEKQPA